MPSLFKKFLGRLKDPTGDDLFVLPEQIKKDLLWNLKGSGEKLILSLKTHRAIHKAPETRNSNTFYNAYAIITSRRLILAKDSSKLNTFREIPLASVENYRYEEENKKPHLKIDSRRSKFILTFPHNSFSEAESFFGTFRRVLDDSKLEELFCSKCEKKIPVDSVYCSHCGEKVGN